MYIQFHNFHTVYFKKKWWRGVGDRTFPLIRYKNLFCTVTSYMLATTADLHQVLSLRIQFKIPTVT
jgi:hypothetical protein